MEQSRSLSKHYAVSKREIVAAGALLRAPVRRPHVDPGEKQWNMSRITRKAMPKLPKVSQPPLSHRGATPDSDRAKRPSLTEPSASDQELAPGDRVEGLGDFGKPSGEFGTVRRANEDDAEVKWDDDGCARVHRPSLRRA